MPNRFASGRHSISECDRCGFRYKLKDLKTLTIKTKNVNLLVCSNCWEEDHPQLQLGMYPVDDPQAVRDPRPDTSYYAASAGGDGGSRQIFWGWNPVGYREGLPFDIVPGPNTLIGYSAVGSVAVSIRPREDIAFPTAVIGQGDVSSVSVSGSSLYQLNNFGLSSQSNVGSASVSTSVSYTLSGEVAPMNLGAVTVSIIAGAAGFYTVVEDLTATYSMEKTYGAAVDSSQNSYMVLNPTSGVEEPTIMKFDSTGALQWQKTFTPPVNNYLSYSSVASDGTNVYPLIYGYRDGVVSPYFQDLIVQVAKITPAGALSWVNGIIDPDYTSVSTNGSITYDTASSSLIASSVIYNQTGPYTSPYLGYIVKYDTSGVFQWSTILDTGAVAEQLSNIHTTTNSTGTVVGVVNYSDSATPENETVAITVNNSTGAGISQYPLTLSDPWPSRIKPAGITVDSSDNIYIAAVSFDASGGGGFETSNTLIKLNSSGVLQWNTVLDAGTGYSMYPFSIGVDGTDIYVAYNYTDYPYTTDYGIVIAKFNSSGVLQWQNRYYNTTGAYIWAGYSGSKINVNGSEITLAVGYVEPSGPGTYSSYISLPKDGSGTGVHGAFTYAATTFTTTSLSVISGSYNISFNIATLPSSPLSPILTTSTFTNTVTPF